MKKYFLALSAILISFTLLATPVFAVGSEGYLVDDADLLSNEEEASLEAMLKQISESQNMDVAIVTVNSLGGKPIEAYTDDYYDYNGYGQGDTYDGIMFLVSMGEREYHFSTCGKGIEAFTDSGLLHIDNSMIDKLADGDYYGAFEIIAVNCNHFLNQYHEGEPFDINNMPLDTGSMLQICLISLLGGFIVAIGIVIGMVFQLRTVYMQPAANDYVKNGSFQLARSRDIFLYRTRSKTARPKRSSSSGSSTHRSSSGRSHGGRSGRF